MRGVLGVWNSGERYGFFDEFAGGFFHRLLVGGLLEKRQRPLLREKALAAFLCDPCSSAGIWFPWPERCRVGVEVKAKIFGSYRFPARFVALRRAEPSGQISPRRRVPAPGRRKNWSPGFSLFSTTPPPTRRPTPCLQRSTESEPTIMGRQTTRPVPELAPIADGQANSSLPTTRACGS